MHSIPLCLLPGILGIYTHSEMPAHISFPCAAPQVAPGGLTIPGLDGPVQRSSRHAAVLPLSAGVRVPRVALAPRIGLLACRDRQDKQHFCAGGLGSARFAAMPMVRHQTVNAW